MNNASPLPSQGTPSPNSDAVDYPKGGAYNSYTQPNGKSVQVSKKFL